MRPLGDITHDLEDVLQEMCDDHKLQWGEVLNIVHGYLQVHRPDAQEEYEDGSHPDFHYGCKK